MEDYSLEEIYLLVGREDKTASVTFKYDSDAYKKYGQFITVVFLYAQKEREELDEKLKNKPYTSTGVLKVKYLTGKLSETQIEELQSSGFQSTEIASIQYLQNSFNKNTFHSTQKRDVKTLNIPLKLGSKGDDFDWMYGFKKMLVKKGIGLSPYERNFYLAAKYYFEPDNLNEEEVEELFSSGLIMKEAIEWEVLFIKYIKGELSIEEKKRCSDLLLNKKEKAKKILEKYLNESGSSLKKLIKHNVNQAAELLIKVEHYKDKKLNNHGEVPIYLDIDGYLHIYMRHVEEMQVNRHFEHKDNFQWDEEKVNYVMKEVIQMSNNDIQAFFKKNPSSRYSKYGKQSVYFQGDYYTFHIEANGRVSTFYKNRKSTKKP